jgi:hypothetical protein
VSAGRRFPDAIVDAIDAGKILGIRAGSRRHRFIGVWAVVVERRVFVRSWNAGESGWHRVFRDERRGRMSVNGRELPVRAVHTRSERLKDAVDRAYRRKYDTPGSIRWVRDLTRPRSRATTTELAPLGAPHRARASV